MKRWLFWLVLLAAAGGAGYLLLRGVDPGYVLVYVGGYSFETTITALAAAVFVLVLVFNLLLWLVRTLNPLRLRNTWLFRKMFGRHDPVRASMQGLQELLLGNWQLAYRLLVENAEQVDMPSSNYLAAALAAFQRGDRAGWTFCLESAEKKSGSQAYGVRSLRALLEARSGEQQQALSLLQSLQRLVPNQPFVLQQLQEHYCALGDWEALEQILPELERRQMLAPAALSRLQVQVYEYQLQQAGSEGGQAVLHNWKQLPKALRNNGRLTGIYVQQLLLTGQETEAASVLTAFLKKHWSDDVVAVLGHFNSGKPQQQLALLENCLKQHPDSAVLLLALGRVSVRNQLWRKARDYFDKALLSTTDVAQQAQINAELARLLEQLGEREKSLLCYQRAVQLLEKQ